MVKLRTPVTGEQLIRLNHEKPELTLFALEINAQREHKRQVTLFALSDQGQTYAVRCMYQNYCAVLVPDHFTSRHVTAFTKYVLGSKNKAFNGRTELVEDGQSIMGYMRFGKFIVIYHNEISTPRWICNKFETPVDISRFKRHLDMDADEHFFQIFEANIPIDKRFGVQFQVAAASWFSVAAGQYELNMLHETQCDIREHDCRTMLQEWFVPDVISTIQDLLATDRDLARMDFKILHADPITTAQIEILVEDPVRALRARPDLQHFVPLRILSLDGEMFSKARLFPDALNEKDGNVAIGIYMEYNDPKTPPEPAVLTVFECRTPEQEAKARAAGKAHIYPCDPLPPITREEFIAEHFRGDDFAPGAAEAWLYRSAQSAITFDEFRQQYQGMPDTFEAAWNQRQWQMMQARERRLLHCLSAVFDQFDPDIVITYNGDTFDWPFWYNSALKLQMLEKRPVSEYSTMEVWDLPAHLMAKPGQPQFGRFTRYRDQIAQLTVAQFQSMAKGRQESFRLDMPGRWHIDMLKDVRDSFTLDSYSLDNVCDHFLKMRKLEMNPITLMDSVEKGTPEQKELVAEYCGQDCRLPVKLTDYFKTTAKYGELGRVVLLNVGPIVHNGQQQRVFQGLQRECIAPENKRRVFIPTLPRGEHPSTHDPEAPAAEIQYGEIECQDFHWDFDEKVDEELGLNDCEELKGITDPVELTKETARLRAEKRQFRGEALPGESRPFRFRPAANMTPQEYLSQSQFYSQLAMQAQMSAKVETKAKSKAKTAKKNKKAYSGAIQIEPERGLHEDPTATKDFNSMYPNIIIFFNLSYESFMTEEDVKRNPHLKPRYWKPPTWDAERQMWQLAEITGDYWVWKLTNGETVRFLAKPEHSPHGVEGLLPRMLKKLLAARKVAKKKKAEAQEDELRAKEKLKTQLTPEERQRTEAELEDARNRITIYDQRQNALKVVANSGYGFTGARFGILPQMAIAALVTTIGVTLLRTMVMIDETEYDGRDEEHPKAKVRYGDTDSAFNTYEIPLRLVQPHKQAVGQLRRMMEPSPDATVSGTTRWALEYFKPDRLKLMLALESCDFKRWDLSPKDDPAIWEQKWQAHQDSVLQAWCQETKCTVEERVRQLRRCEQLLFDVEQLIFVVKHAANNTALVNYLLNGAGVVELEKVCLPWLLVTKKRYAYKKLIVTLLLFNGKLKTTPDLYVLAARILDKATLEVSGLSLKRRDFCKLEHEAMEIFFEEVFEYRDLDNAYTRVRQLLQTHYNYKTPIHKLILTKKLAANYKTEKYPHLQVALKKERRAPGSKPPVGSRVGYYYRECPWGNLTSWKKEGQLQQLAEDPEYGMAHDVIYNAEWYVVNQLTKPLLEVFTWASYGALIPANDEKKATFKKYSSLVKAKLFDGLTRVKRYGLCPETRAELVKRGGVHKFFQNVETCALCPMPTQSVVCARCRPLVDDEAIRVAMDLHDASVRERISWLTCYDCPATGGSMVKAKLCQAFGCPNFGVRKIDSMDVKQLSTKLQKLRNLPPVLASEIPPPSTSPPAPVKKRPRVEIAYETEEKEKPKPKPPADKSSKRTKVATSSALVVTPINPSTARKPEYRQMTLSFVKQ